MQTSRIQGKTRSKKFDEAKYIGETDANTLKHINRIRTQLALEKMNINELFNYYLATENFNVIRTAVEKAYNVKIANDVNMASVLVNTGNVPIEYVSNNNVLGIGEDGKGSNLIGITLMQIRHNLQNLGANKTRDESRKQREEAIIETYRAYIYLLNLYQNGDMLTKYIDKPVSFINKDVNDQLEPDQREAILKIVERGAYPEISIELLKSGSLATMIRKEKRGETKQNEINEHDQKIFELYLKYTIQKKFPDLSKEDLKLAISQFQSQAPLPDDYFALRNDVIELSNNNLLSKSLMKKISKLDEVEEVEEVEESAESDNDLKRMLRDGADEEEDENDKNEEIQHDTNPYNFYVKPNGSSVKISALKNSPELEAFSPIHEKDMEIDNLSFPCVSLYLTTMLLVQTGISVSRNGMKIRGQSQIDARKLVMSNGKFLDPLSAHAVYEKFKFQTYKELLGIVTTVAMAKKFKDTALSNLLLLTKDAKLVWGDPTDLFLGAGSKEVRGENYVGNELMKIRETYKSRTFPELRNLNGLKEFIISDSFLHSWIKMRVNDMCRTVAKMKEYKNEEVLDTQFVTNVLDVVYQPCNELIKYTEEVDTKMPEWFLNLVRDCKGTLLESNKYESKIVKLEMEKSNLVTNFWGVKIKRSDRDIEKEQRIAWAVKMEELLEPFLSRKEIEKEIKSFRKKNKTNLVDEEKKRALYKKEYAKLLKRLYTPKLSRKEIRHKISKFAKKQEEEYKIFYNIIETVKTTEEITEHNSQLKDISESISELIKEKKQQQFHNTIRTQEIGAVYWKRITIMVYFLVQHIKKSNTQDIRLAISSIEMLNSGEIACSGLNVNLRNERDNCIASALCNLLINIMKFNQTRTFGREELVLASEIILGKNIVEEEILEKDEVREEEIVFDDDMAEEEERVSNQEENFDEWGYKDDEVVVSQFSLKRPDTNVESIKIMISEIAQFKPQNLEATAEQFIHMMNAIKGSKVSDIVKQNRINFFATLI